MPAHGGVVRARGSNTGEPKQHGRAHPAGRP